ncbi:unnamed protein product [Sphagnum balticum]
MRMFAQMTVIALVLSSVFCVSTTPVSAAITTWAPVPAPSRPSWTTKAYSPGPAPAASAPTSTHLPGSRRGHVAAPVPAPKPSGVSAAPGPAPPGYYAPAPAPVGPISAAAASASSLPSFTTAAISLISALVFIAAAASS